MEQLSGDLYDPDKAGMRTDELRSILERKLDDYQDELRNLKRAAESKRTPAALPEAVGLEFATLFLQQVRTKANWESFIVCNPGQSLTLPNVES